MAPRDDPPETAQEAYDRFAPVYDRETARNDYETWIGQILIPELVKAGLRQEGWALDVGCGTGRSFGVLLARGWRIVGCDVSQGMLDKARQKFGSSVDLVKADARALPVLFPQGAPGFDLALLLNDVLNYLTDDDDLVKLFEGIKRNLNPSGGLLAFDANTQALLRRDFRPDPDLGHHQHSDWQPIRDHSGDGSIYEARFIGPGAEAHVHRQRHWKTSEVQDALAVAGLRCLSILGQREINGEIRLSRSLDDSRDDKTLFIAGLAA